ncbi:MAG: enoyl-CoA hydratase/isomerase family protein [Planctomycetota bacterium]
MHDATAAKLSVRRVQLVPNGAGRVTLDAPSLGALTQTLRDAEADRDVGLIALEAPRGGFCFGMDLDAIAHGAPAECERGIHAYTRCLEQLRGSNKLVVALVAGPALGAGLGLAACADIVIATTDARFGLPEVVLGLAPAIVLTTLNERLSPQKARRLALSGASLSALEAATLGIVDQVVPDVDALERALAKVRREAQRSDADARACVKQLCREFATLDPAAALRVGADCTRTLLTSAKVRAAVREFAEHGVLRPQRASEERER